MCVLFTCDQDISCGSVSKWLVRALVWCSREERSHIDYRGDGRRGQMSSTTLVTESIEERRVWQMTCPSPGHPRLAASCCWWRPLVPLQHTVTHSRTVTLWCHIATSHTAGQSRCDVTLPRDTAGQSLCDVTKPVKTVFSAFKISPAAAVSLKSPWRRWTSTIGTSDGAKGVKWGAAANYPLSLLSNNERR